MIIEIVGLALDVVQVFVYGIFVFYWYAHAKRAVSGFKQIYLLFYVYGIGKIVFADIYIGQVSDEGIVSIERCNHDTVSWNRVGVVAIVA